MGLHYPAFQVNSTIHRIALNHLRIVSLMCHLGYSTYSSRDDPVFPGYKLGHPDRQVTTLKGFHHCLPKQDSNHIHIYSDEESILCYLSDLRNM